MAAISPIRKKTNGKTNASTASNLNKKTITTSNHINSKELKDFMDEKIEVRSSF